MGGIHGSFSDTLTSYLCLRLSFGIWSNSALELCGSQWFKKHCKNIAKGQIPQNISQLREQISCTPSSNWEWNEAGFYNRTAIQSKPLSPPWNTRQETKAEAFGMPVGAPGLNIIENLWELAVSARRLKISVHLEWSVGRVGENS